MVEVNYRDGTKKIGYIAETEKRLIEKPVAPVPETPKVKGPEVTSLPVGTIVNGQLGYVRTPFEPSVIVDVRGIKPGGTARDPNTGKDFRVPMDIAQPAPETKPEEKPNRSMGEGHTSSPEGRPMGGDPFDAGQKKPETTPKSEKKEAPEIPFGTPIEGRPGLVNSPYAGKFQLVDVTGLSPGQEVKCPYTGKMFRVPAPYPTTRPQSKE